MNFRIIDTDSMRHSADIMEELLSSSDYNQEMKMKLLGMVEVTVEFYDSTSASSYREQAIIALNSESDVETLKLALSATLKAHADAWEKADRDEAARVRNLF